MSVREGQRPICPICGVGTLADIVFDVDPSTREPAQSADSGEMVLYSCGHRVPGPPLDEADETELDVERRTSEETVDPGPS
ncbi:MAG: hypothetical protein H0X05_05395 [Actinobacteria bacterium]|nr:hypothetical protein [Actinomycetota bacterium]